jgi:lipoyl(octanoyl) transferase
VSSSVETEPTVPCGRAIDVRRLGRLSYPDGLDLQRELVEQRRAGTIGDTLLLVEHPPVVTLGARNRAGASHIVSSPETLERDGISVHETGRGGDVTYHGPGQLVGYPILDLRPDRCDVHRYVRDLEQVLVDALAEFDIAGVRVQGWSGVWTGPAGHETKIAAIGVRISRWITSHGFALNVNTDLSHFRHIVPCGIVDRGVTSMQNVIGSRLAMADVEDAVERAFGRLFAGASVPGRSAQ